MWREIGPLLLSAGKERVVGKAAGDERLFLAEGRSGR
jgi:hypothetical protein